MSVSGEDRDRQVVPRWRSFADAGQFGELQPIATRPPGTFSEALLAEDLEDWQKEKGLSIAADLVSSAVTIGLPNSARDAARYVLSHEHAPSTAREVAKHCLDDAGAPPSELFVSSYKFPSCLQFGASIRSIRQRLAVYPYNPVLWTNLSLIYISLGQVRKAERAMAVALALAPHDRFVVRAACRLFLHQHDSERAHEVLLRAESTKHDPWLLASEIAVASVRRRSSSNIKVARRMVDAGKVRPFHLSELSGALGTLEVVSGHRKNAAKLLEYSMTEPAENAIAQVAWIIRNVDSSVIKPIALITDRSSEASAWVARAAGDWNDAFDHAKQWQMEQPFSSRPALIASHAASTGLEDFDAAVEVLEQGLLCNPDDSSLLNNHAFAMAKQNRLIEARQSLARAVNLSASPDTRICLTATEGLIEFRSGNVELGRKLYRKAMSDAAERSDNGLGEVAQINLAIEEGLAHTAVATESIREAIENAKSLRSPYRETFLKKLARLTAPASL